MITKTLATTIAVSALLAPAAAAGPTKTIEAGVQAIDLIQAASPDGTAHILYGVQDPALTDRSQVGTLRYCRLPQAAATCTHRTDIKPAEGLRFSGAPAVVSQGPSDVLLFWTEQDPAFGGGFTQFRRSTDGGVSFGAPVRIDGNPAGYARGQGIVAGPGTGFSINPAPAHFVAKDAAGKTTGSGTGFRAPAPYDYTGSQIGFAGGRPFAVIQNDAGTETAVFASKAGDPNVQSTWQQVGGPIFPRNVVSNDTVAYVYGVPRERTVLHRFDGTTVEAPVELPFDAGDIALEPSGTLHLTSTGPAGEILLRTSTDGGRTFTSRTISDDAPKSGLIEASAPGVGHIAWFVAPDDGTPGVYAANFTEVGTGGAGGTGAGTGGGAQPPAGDRTAPALSGRLRVTLSRTRVQLRGTAGEASTARVTGTLTIGRRKHRLKGRPSPVSAGRPFVLRVSVPRAARKALGRKAATAKVRLVLTDPAGNAAAFTGSAKLRPAPRLNPSLKRRGRP